MNAVYCFILTLFFLCNLSLPAKADITPNKKCVPTPQINDLKYLPHKFSQSNDLRNKPGALEIAIGKSIQLSGKLLDKNCSPIEGATVQIWQANSDGQYQSENGNIKDLNSNLAMQYDPNFAGSGTAITNSNGEFTFFSILPGSLTGSLTGSAPHINVIISSPLLEKFVTKIYFSDVIANVEDADFKKLTPAQQSRVIAITYSDSNLPASADRTEDEEPSYVTGNIEYSIDIILDQALINKSK